MEIWLGFFRIRADNLSGTEYTIPGTLWHVLSRRHLGLLLRLLIGRLGNVKSIRQTCLLAGAVFLLQTVLYPTNHSQRKYPKSFGGLVCL